MRACLGQLLVNSPVQTQGEAWLAMAKCEIAESSLGPVGMGDTSSGEEVPAGGRGSKGDAEAGTTGTAGLLRRAVLHLDRAVELLKQCHHFSGLRECWYLKVGRATRAIGYPTRIFRRMDGKQKIERV